MDRRRPSLLKRLFAAPLSAERIEARAKETAVPVSRKLVAIVPLLLFIGSFVTMGLMIARVWALRTPVVEPRHRAEAVCFALATPPVFSPPMRIEPSAALKPTRLSPATPPTEVLQQTMGYSNEMIVARETRHVGDYDVAIVWLRITDAGAPQHWLILAWMEGSNLAVCNFRFEGDAFVLSPTQQRWGRRLLDRVLTPENFRAGELPHITLRTHDTSLPTLGPG